MMASLDPTLDKDGSSVYRVIPHIDDQHNLRDIEYVLTVFFEGGPITLAVIDSSAKEDVGQALLTAQFTDAETRILRFEPDPYFRTPSHCTSSGSLAFRVPASREHFLKRVTVSVVLTNLLDGDKKYRVTLFSPNNPDPAVVDLTRNVPAAGQHNVVFQIGFSSGVDSALRMGN